MLRLVTDPDGFLRDARRDGSWLGPLAVVATVGVLVGGEPALYVLWAPDAGTTALLQVILGPVLLVVFWVVLAVVTYALSMLVDGGGGFLETFKLVGWGFFALLVSNLLTVLVVVATLTVVGVEGATVEALRANVEATAFYQVLDSLPVKLAFVVWGATLWTFAVRHGRRLSITESIAVVGLPTLLLVGAWLITTLLG
jgi:hypothetical protein